MHVTSSQTDACLRPSCTYNIGGMWTITVRMRCGARCSYIINVIQYCNSRNGDGTLEGDKNVTKSSWSWPIFQLSVYHIQRRHLMEGGNNTMYEQYILRQMPHSDKSKKYGNSLFNHR